ncbi:MAG: hypothetical protein HN337_01380 [Deltaproteobacteria bacterium]|mgnify:CR=1 FL=1|jgi:hypothetical protein|nr:hypothetical protein [Deltaproteobacteria bacterium]
MKKSLLLIMLVAFFMVTGCGENVDSDAIIDPPDFFGIDNSEEVPIGENPSIDQDEEEDIIYGDDTIVDSADERGSVTRRSRSHNNEKKLRIVAIRRLPDAVVGLEYSYKGGVIASGGAGGYEVTADDLPEGLSFDSATKTLSGIPAEAGRYNVKYTVTDRDGETASSTSRLTVNEGVDTGVISEEDEGTATTEENTEDLCQQDIEVRTPSRGYDDNGNANVVVKIEGGKAPYVWENLEYRVQLLTEGGIGEDLGWQPIDGEKISVSDSETGEKVFTFHRNAVSWGYSSKSWKNTNSSHSGLDIFTALLRALDAEKREEHIIGYKVEIRFDVSDSCQDSQVYSEPSILIEEVEYEVPTLDKLKIQCDFQDIDHTNGGSHLDIRIKIANKFVAQVQYWLDECSVGDEHKCEDVRRFKKRIEAKRVKELSEYRIDEIQQIWIWKHKKRGGHGASKLDVDLRWCRLFTDDGNNDKDWYAVLDDQLNGDTLNENEVGGTKHWHKNDSTRKAQYSMFFTEFPNIWRPSYTLPEEYKVPESKIDASQDNENINN